MISKERNYHKSLTRLFGSVLLILTVLSFIFPFHVYAKLALQQNTTRDRAQALLDTLTPEERVGQLFLITFAGANVDQDSQIYDLILNYHVGGVLLQSASDNFVAPPQTLTQARQLIRDLQTTEWTASQNNQIDPVTSEEFSPAFIPLFIGISQEGNGPPYDQIINGLTPLPSNMAIGASWQPEMANKIGQISGKELSTLGFNLLLGPSLDVLETPREKGLGDLGVRTFGGDPFWVGEMGRAYVTGIHNGSLGQMAVVAKHFPGHGSSDRLPEDEVSTVRKSLEQLKQIELPPFYAVTGNAPSPEATVDGLLASHIRYQGFQGNIRETTRPVSLDRQAFDQLMSLPPLATWRENGGVMVSDNLGSRAFRRSIDPTGQSFQARFIARDAFLAGNDLLFLGQDFISTEDSNTYSTIIRTLAFFAQKYREDSAFQQQVDESVLRILMLKYRLYDDIFTLSQVISQQDSLENIGKSGDTTFEVAQNAATLISPSLTNLAENLPNPPNLNDRIVFITDNRIAKQCSECPDQAVFATDALENAVIRLYGPLAGGQILQRNLDSYSYEELQALLDQNPLVDLTTIENDINQASWLVFSMLNISTILPTSQTLSRFLAERPDLFRQKNLVVFAFDAPYYLDATEISKLSAYYGLYSKEPQFIETAARLLFGEIPSPPGDLPVSVSGVDYDLISATSPNESQTIELFIDIPESSTGSGTSTPEPTPAFEYTIGDLIPVRTGIILDHNGHSVPDGTPVQFILGSSQGDLDSQTETTTAGVARTTFLVENFGTLTIRAQSEPALDSTILQFDIPPESGTSVENTPTSTLTPSPTPEILATTTITIESTPSPESRGSTDIFDWLLASIIAAVVGGAIFWFTSTFGTPRWGLRSSLFALIGGLLAYIYLASGLPGSTQYLQAAGTGGVLALTLLGCGLGWGASWGWQKIQEAK